MELLFIYAYLWIFGFTSDKQYNDCLDRLFLKNEHNDILLELELCSNNPQTTLCKVNKYLEEELININKIFAPKFIYELTKIYKSNIFHIAEFADKCYTIWVNLPSNIGMKNPFFIFSYANDCLAYGDVKQTQEFLESAFSFYQE